MVCTIHGMVCNVGSYTSKDGKSSPTVSLFTGDEAVVIQGIEVDFEKYRGQQIDIPCEVKLRNYEGRFYLTYKAI